MLTRRIYAFFRRKTLKFISYDDSPLMHFARFERFDRINFNEISRSDVEFKNSIKETVFALAIKNQSIPFIQWLLERFEFLKDQEILENKFSPIMLAGQIKNENIFKLLLNNGANLNYVSPLTGDSVISIVASHHPFLAEVMNHPDFNLNHFPILEKNPIVIASSNVGNRDLIYKMIDRGFADGLSNEGLLGLCKHLSSKFEYDIIDYLLSRIQVSDTTTLNHVFSREKEEFFEGKFLLRQENFNTFTFSGAKLENFHKRLGLGNRDITREFYKNILINKSKKVYSVNLEMVTAIYFLKKHFDFDENLLRPVTTSKSLLYIHPKEEKFLKEILSHYDIKRIIKLLTTEYSHVYVKELIFTFELLKRYSKKHKLDPKMFLIKKPKSIRQIYERLEKILSQIGRDKIPIDGQVPFSILNIDQTPFDKYSFYIPKNNSELISVGSDMAICVGNNFFATQMASGISIIIFLKEKNKVNYCIEYNLSSKQIIQAKTYYNTDMNKELYLKLEKFLSTK